MPRRSTPPALIAVFVPLVFLLAACASPPTQVVVRLATDLRFPAEFDSIGIEVLDADGTLVREQDVRELDGALLSDGRFHEVASFGLVPRGGDSSRRFEVRATARLGPNALFATRARSGFVRDNTIRLDVYVPRLCIDIAASCQPDETCGVTGCVDPEIDPTDLPSNEEIPPTDPVDPRMPTTVPDFVAIRPMVGERVSTHMPTLEVSMARDIVGVEVHLCDDSSCTSSTPTAGNQARVMINAAERVHYWFGRGERGGEIVESPIYWFVSRAVDRGVDSTCGQVFDFDGDHVPDVLVGAPGTGATGAAYVFLGADADPSTWTRVDLAAPPGVERFGASIGTGDIDGDGRMEVVVGAPATFDGGRAVVYEPDDPGNPVVALEARGSSVSRFGENVHGVGDVNGDGYADMAISGAEASGEVVVELWLGSPTGLRFHYNENTVDAFTASIAGGGDIDGDGFDDFVIGAPDRRVTLLSLLVRGSADGIGISGVFPLDPPTTGYGASVAFGDIAGDGRCDFVIGSPDDGNGRLYASIDNARIEPFSPGGSMAGDRLGNTVILVDLDDDGLDDIVANRDNLVGGEMPFFVIRGPNFRMSSMETLFWTMPSGTGTARIRAIGNTNGGFGSELVAAEIGEGVTVLDDGAELGNLAVPAGAVEAGTGLR